MFRDPSQGAIEFKCFLVQRFLKVLRGNDANN